MPHTEKVLFHAPLFVFYAGVWMYTRETNISVEFLDGSATKCPHDAQNHPNVLDATWCTVRQQSYSAFPPQPRAQASVDTEYQTRHWR